MVLQKTSDDWITAGEMISCLSKAENDLHTNWFKQYFWILRHEQTHHKHPEENNIHWTLNISQIYKNKVVLERVRLTKTIPGCWNFKTKEVPPKTPQCLVFHYKYKLNSYTADGYFCRRDRSVFSFNCHAIVSPKLRVGTLFKVQANLLLPAENTRAQPSNISS